MVGEFSLRGKVAVVTGASRGIGRYIALGFAKAGADLVLVATRPQLLQEVAQDVRALGRRALAVRADISRLSEVDELVKQAVQSFGRIDILVNNAGISPIYKSAHKVTESEFDQIVSVNLKGTFFVCQKVGSLMIEQRCGKIVNIASVGGVVGLPKLSVYCATKGAVIQLTKVLALDWAPYNVQVNAIAPGYVETDFTAGIRSNAGILSAILVHSPVGRMARPEEIVGAAIFLASDASSYITGSTIFVDGGWTAW